MRILQTHADWIEFEPLKKEIKQAEEIEKKKQEFLAELANDNKPEEIKLKIIEGKLNKWYSDVCLVKQSFIKDEDKTIEQVINEKIAKIGEKIAPTRFTRMQMAAPAQTC